MTDCMQLPAHHREALISHATRIVHNIFHPHHKVPAPFVLPVASFQVCAEPELETITVTAPAWAPPSDTPDAPTYHGFGGGGSGLTSQTYYSGGYVGSGGGMPHAHPVTCPEVSADGAVAGITFVFAMMAVIVGRRKHI